MAPVVKLRYWDCRGRAEFLRMMLRDHDLAFEEEVIGREEASDWPEMKRMVNVSGPYGQLPVLCWADSEQSEEIMVSQTLAIGHFLHSKLGGEQKSAEKDSKAMALACYVQEELNVPMLLLIWGKGSPEAFVGKTAPGCLLRLDVMMPEEGWLLGGDLPCWAEYLLFAALNSLTEMFGPSLLRRCEVLPSFCQRMRERPGVAAQMRDHPRPVSFCPKEAENLQKINEELQSRGILPPTHPSAPP